jgi:hypothetical protein
MWDLNLANNPRGACAKFHKTVVLTPLWTFVEKSTNSRNPPLLTSLAHSKDGKSLFSAFAQAYVLVLDIDKVTVPAFGSKPSPLLLHKIRVDIILRHTFSPSSRAFQEASGPAGESLAIADVYVHPNQSGTLITTQLQNGWIVTFDAFRLDDQKENAPPKSKAKQPPVQQRLISSSSFSTPAVSSSSSSVAAGGGGRHPVPILCAYMSDPHPGDRACVGGGFLRDGGAPLYMGFSTGDKSVVISDLSLQQERLRPTPKMAKELPPPISSRVTSISRPVDPSGQGSRGTWHGCSRVSQAELLAQQQRDAALAAAPALLPEPLLPVTKCKKVCAIPIQDYPVALACHPVQDYFVYGTTDNRVVVYGHH